MKTVVIDRHQDLRHVTRGIFEPLHRQRRAMILPAAEEFFCPNAQHSKPGWF